MTGRTAADRARHKRALERLKLQRIEWFLAMTSAFFRRHRPALLFKQIPTKGPFLRYGEPIPEELMPPTKEAAP